jgi:hypothetical protein
MRHVIMACCLTVAGWALAPSTAAATWTKRTYATAKIAARCTAAQCMTNQYRDRYEMKFLARDWGRTTVLKPGKTRQVIEVSRSDIGYSDIVVKVEVKARQVKKAGKTTTTWVGNLQLVSVDLNHDGI